MVLHPLFHWSPTERRAGIKRRGLRLSQRPVASSARVPYLCFSQSPSQAWVLSAGVFGERGQEWDCWQVVLDHTDQVQVRPFEGNRIEELRVFNPIPASRIWLVGMRAMPLRGRRY